MDSIRARLCLMMFLQFFVWGAWFVTLGTFLATNLQASGEQTGMAFATQSWGAIVAPLFIGLIADRFFNAERILGLLHLAGAALLWRMYAAGDFGNFYAAALAYMVVYMPTLALANAVCFRQMRDTTTEFPPVRMWGTVGWIAAGLSISYVFAWDDAGSIAAGQLRNTFLLAAAASLALGLYCFTLPATPPVSAGQSSVRSLLGVEALGLLKDRNFAVFFCSAILICVPLAFYYQNANLFLAEAGAANPTGRMTIGQISEAGFILLLPWFFHRFGFKRTLLVGMAAWGLRYALFAFGNAAELLWMLLVGIALHGVCYDFFFVAGQVYTDARAGPRIKASAQGLITLATYGLGMLIGFWVAGMITDRYTLAAGHDWRHVWLFPSGFALVVLGGFLLLFRDTNERTATEATR
jgi:nucleoside transporter